MLSVSATSKAGVLKKSMMKALTRVVCEMEERAKWTLWWVRRRIDEKLGGPELASVDSGAGR